MLNRGNYQNDLADQHLDWIVSDDPALEEKPEVEAAIHVSRMRAQAKQSAAKKHGAGSGTG